jgi:hypothetical protein
VLGRRPGVLSSRGAVKVTRDGMARDERLRFECELVAILRRGRVYELPTRRITRKVIWKRDKWTPHVYEFGALVFW